MEPISLTGTVLLLPLASALVILLFHGLLKNVAHLVSTGVSIVMFCCALIFLGAADQPNGLLLYEYLKVGTFSADIGFVVDTQSRGMLFIVTFIGMLVHIYSLGYMKDDDARARYFGALSLFMFSMNGIVLADNLVMMFIFWELVGVSSYLLIGHWFKKPEAADAAKKAFLTNRVGDFGFMAGILILFGLTGHVSIAQLQGSMESGALNHIKDHFPWVITLAGLGLFLGAMGKSAQAPLHVWLPDAMEGPTPVSALIHAATMVAAGVYMLVRVYFIIGASHVTGDIIAWIGGITALMAALMATQQSDIKKILAYSTLSQLGYMVMAVGLGGPKEGMFHLYTHAFFKAMLFLGSGAVIYACHHQQNIWKMGGLSKKMPITFVTFAIGTAALMGVPPLSGFWSKEGILGMAYPGHGHGSIYLFVMAVLTATLTAFYMTRLVVVAFFGKTRSNDADHAHEAPVVMWLPLLILAVPSIVAGFDVPALALQALIPGSIPIAGRPDLPSIDHSHGHTVVMACSIVAVIVGFLTATRLYKNADKDPVNIPLFANKFYIDEFYAGLVKYGQDRFAWLVTALERIFVDGLTVRLPAALASGLGSWMRGLQSGSLQAYTFVLGLGIVVVVYLAVFFSTKP